MIGESVGHYRIISKLGEGGMGEVFLAEHPLIGRKAAVKVLLPQFSANQAVVSVAPSVTPRPIPTSHLVKLHLDSQPAGAEVFRDDRRLGRTPMVVESERGSGKAVFRLRLPGYRDAQLSLPVDGDGNGMVTLVSRGAGKSKPAPPPGVKPPAVPSSEGPGSLNPFQ